MQLGICSHCERWGSNTVYVMYLWIEADLADVTGDDWPLGLDQWNSKGVIDYGFLHWVHLPERMTGEDIQREREKIEIRKL